MTYRLYFSPGSAALVVHQALLEIGAPFELHKLDTEAREHKQAAYLALNPNGTVPTLVIDGKPHYETCALLLALVERHPEARLAPPVGDPTRIDFLQWMIHLANTMQPAFRLWFYPSDASDDSTQYDAIKDKARSRIEELFARFDALMADGRPYLLGDRFSVLDLYLVMLMRWSRNMPKPALTFPHLRALADRVRARPSWDAMYEQQGLTEWQR